jgi:hypothetical protein
MLQALTQRPDPMAGIQQAVALMASMKDLMANGAAPAPAPRSSVSEIIDAIKELKSVQSLIGGESNPKCGRRKKNRPHGGAMRAVFWIR